jgi:hypothetical protein
MIWLEATGLFTAGFLTCLAVCLPGMVIGAKPVRRSAEIIPLRRRPY